ncbi:MAG: hypothetical protein WCO00_01410 [Rhodospirillaceae bacterium]
MDIRTISSAAYSRPAAPIVGSEVALPAADSTKSADSAAPFLSPVYRFDPVAKLSILSFRDSSTGDVTQQIPSEKVVAQYRRNRGENPDAKPAASAAGPSAVPAPATETAKPEAERPTTANASGATAVEPGAVPAFGSEPAVSVPPPVVAAPAAPEVQRVSLSV